MARKIQPYPLRILRQRPSCDSTIPAKRIFVKGKLEAQQQQETILTPPRPHVTFADDQTKVHTLERVSDGESSHVWYTDKDFAKFHRQTQELAAYLTEENRDDLSLTLLRVYCVFRGNGSTQEIMDILQSATGNMDEYIVGLIGGIVPAIEQDFQMRRQHLLNQIGRLQATPMADESMRARMICETSRLTSRASRLFAGYTAHMAAEER